MKHIPVDVQALDCDFFAFSGHKMYAETGIGILYGKQKWLDAMSPGRYGGGMVSHVDFGKSEFLDAPQKFEAGTGNAGGAVSLDAAITYINRLGRENIAAHENRLFEYAQEQLRSLNNVTVYGNASEMCGALSFNLKMGVAVRTGKHCAAPLMKRLGVNGTIRASFAVYNTTDEIDTLVEAITRVQKMMD
jgi:cysteine desulfurase/selenocysteine lyase